VHELAELTADRLLPLGQGVDVVVDARVPLITHDEALGDWSALRLEAMTMSLGRWSHIAG